MNIFVEAYVKKNLGDDLFLKIISERYIDNFSCFSFKNYNINANLKFLNWKKYKFINRAIKLISLNKYSIKQYIIKKSDLIVVLGGSMFIESKSDTSIYNLKSKKKIFIIGSNFGPFTNEKYYKKFYKIFSHANDVCFRDKYSYDLFKNLPNIRYASDIVFGLDTNNIKITNNKKVIISVINCEQKIGIEYKELYERKVIDLIKFFNNKHYKITLMSFCKGEGDEETIKSIISKLNNIEITKYYYNGNISEALNVLGDSQIIVGSRFHANILGLIMNKTIIPIAYSDKTINVLKDMNFKGKVFDIRDTKNFDIGTLTNRDLRYKLDVSFQRKDAEKHFENLDKILIKRNNDNNE